MSFSPRPLDPIIAWAPSGSALPRPGNAGYSMFWRGYEGRREPGKNATPFERRAYRAGTLRRQQQPGLTPGAAVLSASLAADRLEFAKRTLAGVFR